MSGYEYLDFRGRPLQRDTYDDRVVRDISRANDSYRTRRPTPPPEGFGRRRRSSSRPRIDEYDSQRRSRSRAANVPILTLNEPQEIYTRRSIPPEDRSGPYGSFLRDSMTPPPRTSRRRVAGFDESFGDVPRRHGRSSQRLQYDPSGPENPYYSQRRSRSHPRRSSTPYGGNTPPRNPFGPGGGIYNNWVGGRPFTFGDESFDEAERRRRSYYRSGMGEPWGVAQYAEYETRRRNEERMRRLYGDGR